MARSPREDKERDYKRQSNSAARHGLRKQLQRIKAKAHRRYRRAESSALGQVGTLADDRIADRVEARIAATRRGHEPRYGGPPTLADHVTDRLVERFLDMVDTYSAGPYKPETQRARTERALTEITRPRPSSRFDGWQAQSAQAVDDLLPERVHAARWRQHRNAERRREWFAAFLADAPEWEPRLVRWIADRVPR
jgi:hypothetical protein